MFTRNYISSCDSCLQVLTKPHFLQWRAFSLSFQPDQLIRSFGVTNHPRCSDLKRTTIKCEFGIMWVGQAQPGCSASHLWAHSHGCPELPSGVWAAWSRMVLFTIWQLVVAVV